MQSTRARSTVHRLIAVALLALPAAALPQSQASAPRAGAPAPEALLPVLDGLAQRVERGAFHGAVAVVEVDGERVLEEALGLRRLEPEEAMTTDTIFRIYSMTKPITAVAAMILVEEEKLALEDPVSRHLPAFGKVTVGVEHAPLEREMTVLDLFRHTSGLTYGMFAVSDVDTLVREANLLDPGLTLEQMVERLAGLPLKHQPGTQFEYSLSSDVLGRVVEVVSGMPLDRFMREQIFAPLGMVDTGFAVAPESAGRLAELYARGAGGLQPARGFADVDPTVAPRLLSGGGGLFSTAGDYVRFVDMLLNGGALDGKRVLAPESVALMMRDHLGDIPAGGLLLGTSGFGLGLAVIVKDTDAGGPGTCWWGGAAGTGFWIDPRTRVTGVFMIQNMMELLHADAFRADVYAALDR